MRISDWSSDVCSSDLIAAGGRIDGGVDADDIARQIEHRTAGVALVDRSVGLDIAVVSARADIAVTRRHDPSRHSAAKDEGVADRHPPRSAQHRGGEEGCKKCRSWCGATI